MQKRDCGNCVDCVSVIIHHSINVFVLHVSKMSDVDVLLFIPFLLIKNKTDNLHFFSKISWLLFNCPTVIPLIPTVPLLVYLQTLSCLQAYLQYVL